MDPTQWTNAMKAQVISITMILIGVAGTLGIDIPEDLGPQLIILIGALFSTYTLLTYKESPRRTPDVNSPKEE